MLAEEKIMLILVIRANWKHYINILTLNLACILILSLGFAWHTFSFQYYNYFFWITTYSVPLLCLSCVKHTDSAKIHALTWYKLVTARLRLSTSACTCVYLPLWRGNSAEIVQDQKANTPAVGFSYYDSFMIMDYRIWRKIVEGSKRISTCGNKRFIKITHKFFFTVYL